MQQHVWDLFIAGLQRAGVARPGSVAVALSGGPDSLALAALTARWQRDHQRQGGGAGPAVALIVDHSLRPESAEEAAGVAATAARLGLQPHVLHVDWPSGRPRVQDKMVAARDARYALLLDACSQLRRGHLLVAHHADDQAETFLLRLLHASGICGLACMPLVTTALSGEGAAVVRPLLGARKRELEGYCREAGLAYVTDPTNADTSYARNRIRHLLEQQERQGQGGALVADVLRLQRACGRAAASQQAQIAVLLREAVLLTSGIHLPSAAPLRTEDSGLASLEARDHRSIAAQLARRLPPGLRFAFCSVPELNCGRAAEAVCVAALCELLGAVGGGSYPASARDGKALGDAMTLGRMAGKYTGGGCYVQPVPGSKGRLCVVVPLAAQSGVEKALQGALKTKLM